MPTAQLAHDAADPADRALLWPAAQFVHAPAPAREKKPGEHAAQAVPPAVKVPAPQFPHVVEARAPAGDVVPEGQPVHVAWFDKGWYLPTAQLSHAVPTVAEEPAAQPRQAVAVFAPETPAP